jgi:two-component system chemotaxis response regulator CheB
MKPPESRAQLVGGSHEIVVVGASTGGPPALHAILGSLPASFPLPILVVQHMVAGFIEGMIEWLRPLCALPIQLAATGTSLPARGIFVAPTGFHLVVRRRAMTLVEEPPVRGHRPSATLLFRSVAEEYGPRAVGVLLTGMGDDGASGLKDLKRAGAVTVAQDEASSVVFGMPGAAIGLGAADHVLSPPEIARLLTTLGTPSGGA